MKSDSKTKKNSKSVRKLVSLRSVKLAKPEIEIITTDDGDFEQESNYFLKHKIEAEREEWRDAVEDKTNEWLEIKRKSEKLEAKLRDCRGEVKEVTKDRNITNQCFEKEKLDREHYQISLEKAEAKIDAIKEETAKALRGIEEDIESEWTDTIKERLRSLADELEGD